MFEVKLKALKATPPINIELAVQRGGKAIAKRSKISEADFDSIFLTDKRHELYDIYGDVIIDSSWTRIPDKLRVMPGTTNLTGTFDDGDYLEEIDISDFDTSTVTNMKLMFSSLGRLAVNTPQIKGLEKLNTSSVTDMSHMFQSAGLTEINLHTWDTSKVTTMCEMFRGCKKLEILDVSGFDTSNVTNFSWIFYGCDNLREVRGVFDLSSSYGTSKTLEFTRFGDKPPKLEKPIQLKNVPRELYIYDRGGMFEILSYKEN